MAILVPSGTSFTQTGPGWRFLPPPGPFVLQDMSRQGQNLNIYETCGVINITAQGNLICPGGTPGPTQPSPELITGISVTQLNCIVLKGPVPTIPEMNPASTPQLSVSSIQSAPTPTLVLPLPLIGNFTEKYMYDGEAGFVESYKGLEVPTVRDNVRSATFFAGEGKKPLSYPERFKKQKEFGGSGGGSLRFSSVVGREGYGPLIHDKAQAGSNYVWSYKPSLIRTLRFFYTITVTSTCPPYTWQFPAYIDVDNNWVNHKKRTIHRLSRQVPSREG